MHQEDIQFQSLQKEPSNPKTDCIRLLLVDDREMILEMLRLYLEAENDLEIVGMATDGMSAIAQIECFRPDVAIVDIEMPDMNGLVLTESIIRQYSNTKVLLLSSHDDPEYVREALRVGAKGYLLKGLAREDLIHAIHCINRGYLQLAPGLFEKLHEFPFPAAVPVPMPVPIAVPTSIIATATSENIVPTSIDGALFKDESSSDLAPVVAEQKEINSLREWSDSTQQALDTLPKVWTKGLIYLFALLTVTILPWSMLVRVDEVGTAKGKLEPKGRTIRLDAPVSGTVVALSVKEGDTVKEGQKLLELESTTIDNELAQQQTRLKDQQDKLNQNKESQERLNAISNAQKEQDRARKLEKQSQLEQAKRNLTALQTSQTAQKQEKLAQIQQAKDEINSLEVELQLARVRYDTAKEKIARYRQAYKDGVISKDRLYESEQAVKENLQSIKKVEAEITKTKSLLKERQSSYETFLSQSTGEIEQAELEVREQQRSYTSLERSIEVSSLNLQDRIKNSQSQANTIRNEIAQSENKIKTIQFQLKQRIIHAPVSGTIFQIPISKPGAVVSTGQAIVQIAPENTPLILRAQIDSDRSGFLKVGLPVKIKFDAYPFQDYGIVSGRLAWIAPDSKNISEGTTQRKVYELEIELEQKQILVGDKTVFLNPGQTATAEIVVRQRRPIDLFLDPFKKLQKNGLEL
jgi:HlyD family secretion protein